jgi:predicted metal-dependent hydrolase
MKTARQLEREIAEHRAREDLLARVRKLLAKWQPILGVKVGEVHTRKMKSYWASINEHDKRMWVSLDLASQPPKYLEYVVVHELVHMLTDGHDAKFYALMDQHLPGWRKTHQVFAGPMTQHS